MTTASGQEGYDVYLSCPMGAVQAAQKYDEVRAQAMLIIDVLEKECQLRCFFFGRDIESRDYLDESDLPVAKITRCLNALKQARYFALLYPAKIASGALAEAGFALALNKKAVYLVRSREHLPFLLRNAESAFPVRIHQYKTMDGLLKVIRTHGKGLFELGGPTIAEAAHGPGSVRPGGEIPLPGTDLSTLVQRKLRELRQTVAEVSEEIQSLEQLVLVDVPSSLNKIRFITEKVLHKLCTQSKVSWGSAEPTLERMLGPLVADGRLPKNVAVHVRTIQMNSSPGSHYQESALTQTHAIIAQQALVEFLEWYAKSSIERPDLGTAGRPPLL